MTTYTSIPNASLAVGGIPSSTTVTLLRDNPIAISEGASGAPIMVTGWHPYDKVTVGDGKTGVIYDFSVTGAQTVVVSPDFEDGYEYRFFGRLDGLSSIELYNQTTAAYMVTAGSVNFGDWFDLEIPMPRVTKAWHLVRGSYALTGNNNAAAIITKAPANNSTPSSKILRVRFTTGTTVSGDKIWMMRRREYASSP